MKTFKRSQLILLGVLLLGGLSFPPNIKAENSKNNSQGITISPAVINISVLPSDTEKIESVSVKNNYETAIFLSAELKSVDQDSGTFTPSKDLDANLKSVISLSQNQFTVLPGQTVNLDIIVKNEPLLPPGGTYVSLVIKQTSNLTTNTIGLQPAVAATVFVTKEQGAVRALVLTSMKVRHVFWNEPSGVALTFKNNGNVQLVPRGVVLVANNDLSTFYQKGIINQESITILPGKSLTLDVPISKISNSNIPGRQKIMVQYRYDGSEAIITVSKSIWYVPLYSLVILAIITAGLSILAIKLKKRFWPKKPKYLVNSNKKQIPIRDQTDGEKIIVRKG